MPSTRPTVDPVLDILEEMGYDFDELDGDGYKRSLKEAIIKLTIKDPKDPRIGILTLEFQKVKGSRKVEPKEKRTTISGDKLMGREPKKDAPSPTAGKPKLLTGVGKFNTDDVKPADVDKKQKDSSDLKPDKLDSIAKTVESIALLLRRQFNLEKKQQRDSRRQQSKADRDAREDKLEGKPKDKKTGLIPKAIKKPALNFFEKLKRFFLNIVIGAGVMKLFEWLKDPENAEKITQFKDFLINNATWILGGLAAIALLPYIGGIMGVLGAIKGGLLLLKPALALLFSPAGLAALALAAGLGGTLLAMKFIFDKSRDFATGGKSFTAKHKSLDERLKEAGMNRGGVVGKETKRGFKKTGTRNAEQEALFQEVQAERKRLNDLHTAMDNEVKYTIAITPHDVPARKQGRQKYASKVSKEKQKEIRTKVEAKYNKMIETGGVAPKEFLTKESTNLLIEKHRKTGETFSSSEDSTISNEKSSAVVDAETKANKIVPGPSNGKSGGVNIVDGGSGTTGGTVGDSSGGGGEAGEEDEMFSSEDPNDPSVFSSKALYNMGG